MTERTVVLGSSTFKGAFILGRNKSSVGLLRCRMSRHLACYLTTV